MALFIIATGGGTNVAKGIAKKNLHAPCFARKYVLTNRFGLDYAQSLNRYVLLIAL
jgi:hypothetical protein